ncbi:MAG: hypothetical protein AB7S75_09110 [Desulfococcaceae bacterium]
MRKIALVVLAVLMCCAYSVIAQTTDVDGWNETKWGMNEDSVRKIYGDKLLPSDTAGRPDNKEYNPFMLKGLKIADTDFNVKFWFSKSANTLIKVTLYPANQKQTSVYLFKEVNELLTSKYGKQTNSGKDRIEGLSSNWDLKLTKIKTTFNQSLPVLIISYESVGDKTGNL